LIQEESKQGGRIGRVFAYILNELWEVVFDELWDFLKLNK
jgi:hypothetical protein